MVAAGVVCRDRTGNKTVENVKKLGKLYGSVLEEKGGPG
jgi:hypothetical protein